MLLFNPIALRKAKIVYNYGLSECSRIKFYAMLLVNTLDAMFWFCCSSHHLGGNIVTFKKISNCYHYVVFYNTSFWLLVNPVALRKAKIAYNFGLSECNRVKFQLHYMRCCYFKMLHAMILLLVMSLVIVAEKCF